MQIVRISLFSTFLSMKMRKLISIIRNEKLEEIILKINEYGYNILEISLRPIFNNWYITIFWRNF